MGALFCVHALVYLAAAGWILADVTCWIVPSDNAETSIILPLSFDALISILN
jgi:hypothetical protein